MEEFFEKLGLSDRQERIASLRFSSLFSKIQKRYKLNRIKIGEVNRLKFAETKIESVEIPFKTLEQVMAMYGMIRGGQWDYQRVTYDFKFEFAHDGSVYYFRIPGTAIVGEIEGRDCVVKLGYPYLGRHYYPHGVEYNEEFPENVVTKCKERISLIESAFEELELKPVF